MATKPWPGATLEIGKYHVNPEALVWSEEAFLTPAPVLVVDEIGPFEIQEGRGWQLALRALDHRQFKLGIVSIRPSLAEIAIERWQPDEIVDLSLPGHTRIKK
jgi:nucleoside-triphosphatase THEP1